MQGNPLSNHTHAIYHTPTDPPPQPLVIIFLQ